jgi:glycosyltransferase involved in cell wall biosynthesis
MINVAFFLDNFEYGGTELHAVRTAEALDPGRIRLYIAHIHQDGPLFDRYRALGTPMRHVPLTSLIDTGYVRQGLHLRRILRDWNVDIFHSHDLYGNIFGVPWARAAGVPAVIASRRWWDSTPRRSHRVANRWASRLAHAVTANSAAVGRLAEAEGVPPARVHVFPNFIEPAAFRPEPDGWRRMRRAELGIPEDAVTIGSVGRLEPVKDHATLLNAFAQLVPRGAPCHLVVVGNGSTQAILEQLARKLGIWERTHFVGAWPSRPNPYQLFDIAALTSLSEGFPNSLVEAMAAGCPAVATAVGGVPQAVIDGVSGLLVPPGDVAATTDALQRLVDSPATRIALGREAVARARLLFDRDAVVGSLMDWYVSLARSGDTT